MDDLQQLRSLLQRQRDHIESLRRLLVVANVEAAHALTRELDRFDQELSEFVVLMQARIVEDWRDRPLKPTTHAATPKPAERRVPVQRYDAGGRRRS